MMMMVMIKALAQTEAGKGMSRGNVFRLDDEESLPEKVTSA